MISVCITPIVRLDHQILLKSPPPQTLLAGSTNPLAGAQVAKNPERLKIFQYSKKFQDKLCFSGQTQVVQNLQTEFKTELNKRKFVQF